MTARTKKKDPPHVAFATAPVNGDGLTEMEEKKIQNMASHRTRQDLRAAYIEYKKVLATKSEADFLQETETRIHMSSFANNNAKSDFHWQCDLCYDEAVRRGGDKAPLYSQAYKKVAESLGIS